MTSSKVISKENLSAYERWELPHVKGRARTTVEQDPSLRPPTAEEIEAIRKAAHKDGFEQGKAEGLKAGEKAIEAAVQRLTQLARSLAQPLESVDQQVEEELAALAIAIAQQIIRRELKTDPGEVVAVVREAMAELPASARHISIALHPDDAQLIREAIAIPEDGDTRWQITEDPAMTRGGCKLTTEHSQIDATVEHRINTIVAHLLGGERRDDDRPAD